MPCVWANVLALVTPPRSPSTSLRKRMSMAGPRARGGVVVSPGRSRFPAGSTLDVDISQPSIPSSIPPTRRTAPMSTPFGPHTRLRPGRGVPQGRTNVGPVRSPPRGCPWSGIHLDQHGQAGVSILGMVERRKRKDSRLGCEWVLPRAHRSNVNNKAWHPKRWKAKGIVENPN